MLTWPLYSIDQISTIVNYHGISIDSIIGCVGGRLNIALIKIGIIASSIEGYVILSSIRCMIKILAL